MDICNCLQLCALVYSVFENKTAGCAISKKGLISLILWPTKNLKTPCRCGISVEHRQEKRNMCSAFDRIIDCTCLLFLLSIPFIIFAHFFLSPSLIVTQAWGHKVGSYSSLSPLRYAPCICIARRFQHFLPASTRVEFGCAWLLSHKLDKSDVDRST